MKAQDVDEAAIRARLLKMHEADRLKIQNGNYVLSGLLKEMATISKQRMETQVNMSQI